MLVTFRPSLHDPKVSFKCFPTLRFEIQQLPFVSLNKQLIITILFNSFCQQPCDAANYYYD